MNRTESASEDRLLRTNGYSEFLGQMVGLWPHLFIAISVIGLAYEFLGVPK